MFLNSNRWERRFDQIVKAMAWVTPTYGFFYSLRNDQSFPDQIDTGTLSAFAGIYVIALTVLPRRYMIERRRLVVESVALIGCALTMTAVGLTGGANSPYVLLSFTPILFGAFLALFGSVLQLPRSRPRCFSFSRTPSTKPSPCRQWSAPASSTSWSGSRYPRLGEFSLRRCCERRRPPRPLKKPGCA
jgi:peptidoglycan/LPS O-acetylase OafA/YrhL